ncbi:hypothetical protein [Streptococcus ferus]|uniref:hypothetical protein n=1 Tax=Streptococcus ferus TaxID=1345 RepID=UPI00359F4EBE
MNPRKKKKLLISLLAVVTVGIVCLLVYGLTRPKEDKQKTSPQVSKTSKAEDGSDTTKETKELTENDINYKKIQSTLENPNNPASKSMKQEVLKAITNAQNYCQKIEFAGKAEGNVSNSMAMTQNPMVQTFAMVIKINKYSFDSSQLEVYESNSDDVVQFICVMTKAGSDNNYWVGNYNIDAKQLQLSSYQGGDIGATFG